MNLNECKKYNNVIKNIFDREDSIFIPNKNIDQYIITVKEIFNHTNNYIRIFCSNFSNEIWLNDKIQDALEKSIKRGIDIKFATCELTKQANELFKLFNIKYDIITMDINKFPYNFIASDSKMFHLEYNINTHRSVGCANNKKQSKDMEIRFDNLESKYLKRYQ